MKTAEHRNNFDATRIFAACLVIWGHELQLRGHAVPLPMGVPISKTGLDIFFSLSGYLITDSWLRDPHLPRFAARRLLRIMPGLATVVILTAFVFGPLLTSLPIRSYLTAPDTWRYLQNLVLRSQNQLPGVFTDRFGGAVNGSLWSLFPELLCYATVPLLCVLPRVARMGVLVAAMLTAGRVGFDLMQHGTQIVVWNSDLRFMLLEVQFFFAGSLLRLIDADRAGFYRLDVAILICAARLVLGAGRDTLALQLDPLIVAYLVVAFGRARTPVLDRVSRWGDLSYGLYLYAFPIQQFLAGFGGPHQLPLAMLAAGVMGLLSWHLIERPALRLKPSRKSRAS